MKRHAAELITRDPERFFHHDRVFLNNPVVMQGMGPVSYTHLTLPTT